MAAADRSTVQQPPDSRHALIARVERLERALDESKSQLLTLKSETATLVRTVADIRASRGPASVPIPSPRSLARIAAAAVGLAIGITLGVAGWMYLDGDEDVSIASPSAAVSEPGTADSNTEGLAPTVASPSSYAAGLAPNVAAVPARYERGQPPDVASAPGYAEGLAPNVASVPARYTRGQPSDVAGYRRGQPSGVAGGGGESERGRERYVGTLSIDAEPGGEVFIDRKSAGKTPVRMPNLRAGSHLVWIQRDGYRRFTRVVQVPADRVTRVSAELEPLAK